MKLEPLAAIATAVTVAAVAVPFAISGPRTPEPTFDKALSQRPTTADTLPTLGGTLADLVSNPSAARHIGDLAGEKVFIAPGKGGTTCFLHTDPSAPDNGIGGGCIEKQTFEHSAAYVGWSSGGGERVNLVIPVADSYSAAEVGGETIQASNNVALTSVDKHNAKIEVTGDGVPALESELLLDDR